MISIKKELATLRQPLSVPCGLRVQIYEGNNGVAITFPNLPDFPLIIGKNRGFLGKTKNRRKEKSDPHKRIASILYKSKINYLL